MIERTQLHPPGQFSAMGSLDVGRIAEALRTAVETLSHGHVLPVLNALDVFRAALLNAMQEQDGDHAVGKPETASEPASQIPQTHLQESHASDIPRGRLF